MQTDTQIGMNDLICEAVDRRSWAVENANDQGEQ